MNMQGEVIDGTCNEMHVFDRAASAVLCSEPSLLVVSSPPLGSSAMAPIDGETWFSVCSGRETSKQTFTTEHNKVDLTSKPVYY